MKQIKEEMHLEKQWFEDAKKQTPETLMSFINHVMNDYEHDYGTVVHAISACALAAAWAANEAPGAQGGITGFQANFVMWDFVKQWNFPRNKTGLKLLDYDEMLFPQYQSCFEKTIKKDTWERIQDEARELIAKDSDYASPNILQHWQSIVEGKVPFGFTIREEQPDA